MPGGWAPSTRVRMPALPGQGADFPHRQHAAVRVVDMAEADQPSALGHGLLKRRDDGVGALRRMKRIAPEIDHHRLDAVPGRAQVDGLDAAGVVVVGVDDFIARTKVEPQRAEGHTLRGVVGQRHLVGLAANERRQLGAQPVAELGVAGIGGVAEVVTVVTLDGVELRLDDAARRDAPGAGVHVGYLGGGQKLPRPRPPIGFIVCCATGAQISRRRGQRRRIDAGQSGQSRNTRHLFDERPA